tara:strand:- start:121 stop:621 length:501 start_codon:yes stop_codon:yes gene_type:complete
MKLISIIACVLLFVSCFKKEDPIEGCMNPNAQNYNPDAEVDDGSCIYFKGLRMKLNNVDLEIEYAGNFSYQDFDTSGGSFYTSDGPHSFDFTFYKDPIGMGTFSVPSDSLSIFYTNAFVYKLYGQVNLISIDMPSSGMPSIDIEFEGYFIHQNDSIHCREASFVIN